MYKKISLLATALGRLQFISYQSPSNTIEFAVDRYGIG